MSDDANSITEKPKKRGCGFWILIGLGILVGLAVLGTIFGPTEEQKIEMEAKREQDKIAEAEKERATAEARRNSAVKVTAKELFRAYEANEMAAQQAYGDKLLEVTGVVNGVDLDISDEPVVQLRTDNQFMSASVYLTDATQSFASTLSKGQTAVFLCEEVSEVIGMPQLKECVPAE